MRCDRQSNVCFFLHSYVTTINTSLHSIEQDARCIREHNTVHQMVPDKAMAKTLKCLLIGLHMKAWADSFCDDQFQNWEWTITNCCILMSS